MISQITSDPILMSSIVLGLGSVGAIAYAYKNGKSLNPIGSKVRSVSPFKYADHIRDSVRNKAQDEGDQIPDLAVGQLDNLLSHAVAHGREIERAKGQNSDKLYKMVGLALLLTGVNTLGIAVILFG